MLWIQLECFSWMQIFYFEALGGHYGPFKSIKYGALLNYTESRYWTPHRNGLDRLICYTLSQYGVARGVVYDYQMAFKFCKEKGPTQIFLT